MDKLLLREWFALCEGGVCRDFLNEQEKKMVSSGTIILTGVLQKANTKNHNGRIYNRNILEREVNNYQKAVKERRALGECDHPDDSVVNLKNVSHLVREMWWEGDDLMGKIEILPTPSGKILEALVGANVPLGVSSRGLGSVNESPEGTIVQEDFQLICIDVVSEPSTPGAYVKQLYENRAKQTFSKADRLNRILNEICNEG